jgi:hypothetical protein
MRQRRLTCKHRIRSPGASRQDRMVSGSRCAVERAGCLYVIAVLGSIIKSALAGTRQVQAARRWTVWTVWTPCDAGSRQLRLPVVSIGALRQLPTSWWALPGSGRGEEGTGGPRSSRSSLPEFWAGEALFSIKGSPTSYHLSKHCQHLTPPHTNLHHGIVSHKSQWPRLEANRRQTLGL